MKKFMSRAVFFSIGLLLSRSYGRQALFKVVRYSLSRKIAAPAPHSRPEHAIRRYLLSFMLPFWFVPGVLDYAMHRRTDIEKTSGTKESILHCLMMAEIGIPVLLGLVLEINAGFLVFCLGVFFLHEATAFWDVAYATGRREVHPNEQHIHSFLEVLPFCAMSLILCLHWDQALSLLGSGKQKPDLTLRWKRHKVPAGYLLGITSAIFFFIVLPYGEELFRCLRQARFSQQDESLLMES